MTRTMAKMTTTTTSTTRHTYKSAHDFFQACQLTSSGQEPNRMLPTPAHVTNDELEEILPMYLELLYDRVNYRHLFDILENTKVDHKAGHAAAVLLFYPLVVQRERIKHQKCLDGTNTTPCTTLSSSTSTCQGVTSTFSSSTSCTAADVMHANMFHTNTNFPLHQICQKILTDRNILKWCRRVIGLESKMYEALLVLRCTLLLSESVPILSPASLQSSSSTCRRRSESASTNTASYNTSMLQSSSSTSSTCTSSMRDVFLPGCSPNDDANALRELIRELSVIASREEMQYYYSSPFSDIAVDFISALGRRLMSAHDLRKFASEEMEATMTLLVAMRQISEDYDDDVLFHDEFAYYQILLALEERLLLHETKIAFDAHNERSPPVENTTKAGSKHTHDVKKNTSNRYYCNGPDCDTTDALLLKKCSGCNESMYCSKECQRVDWNEGGHKLKCVNNKRQRKTKRAAKKKQARKTLHSEKNPIMQTNSSDVPPNRIIDLPTMIAGKNNGGGSEDSKMDFLQILSAWMMAFSMFLFKNSSA